MSGITIEKDGEIRNYVFSYADIQFIPQFNLVLMFEVYINGQRVYSYQPSNFNGKEFYDNWTTNRQVYEKLCDELGHDYSVIPEDIESEYE